MANAKIVENQQLMVVRMTAVIIHLKCVKLVVGLRVMRVVKLNSQVAELVPIVVSRVQ